jgi:peptidoglycan/LPS O-acetylase OafA/YrhL
VDLFFVISGFLIVTLILRERTATGSISLRNFYGRRVLRIFPVYYGLLAALSVFFLAFPRLTSAHPFFAELPYDASYSSNLIVPISLMGISWSLATEEQFYLLWPPVEKFLGRLVLPILGAVVVANQLINLRVADPWLRQVFGVSHDDLYILQVTFTPICLGVGLAHLLHSERGFARAARFLGSRAAAPCCMALLVLVANLPSRDIAGGQRLAVQLSMAALVGSCVVREDNGLRRFLTWPPIKRIGVISYGMYLYHIVARHIADWLVVGFGGRSPWLEFLLCLVMTICVADLSYRFVEQPVLSLKRYFR